MCSTGVTAVSRSALSSNWVVPRAVERKMRLFCTKKGGSCRQGEGGNVFESEYPVRRSAAREGGGEVSSQWGRGMSRGGGMSHLAKRNIPAMLTEVAVARGRKKAFARGRSEQAETSKGESFPN